jgi:broad specificity phosphatase PhoE
LQRTTIAAFAMTARLLQLQPTDLVVVRHGETAWSRSGQHTGNTDIPLTPAGEAAAAQLEPLLAGVDFAQVLSSPLQRARRTAELAGFGARLGVDADLVEWNYGAYEGLTSAEIQSQAPGWLVFTDGCPNGESPGQVAERVDRLLARVRADQGPTLLFAHGHLLRVLVARWLELPPSEGRRFLLDTATLNVLSHYKGVQALRCWNAPTGG